MEKHNYDKQHTPSSLVTEYEAMSQQGAVVFYEEAVFSHLIDHYQNEEEYASALAVVDIALNQHCFSAHLYYRKAKLLYILCHESSLKQALDVLERAESLSAKNLPIILLKIQVLAKLRNFAAAFSSLYELKNDFALNSAAELAEVYFCEGVILECLEEYGGMYHAWGEALLLNNRHSEILQRIWVCIERSRKYDDCIKLFETIIDNDPYCHLAWFYLGEAFAYKGLYKKAIQAYEYAFIIAPEFEEAYMECATNCLILKDYTKALDCYEEALMYVAPDGELLFNIGLCYEHLGNEAIALNFYYKSIDVDSYNDEAYFHIGNCLSNQERWTSAIHYFKRAISLDSGREEYYAALAWTYYHLEAFEKAFNCFHKATELAPEESSFWVDFATFLFRVGYFEEALKILNKADAYSCGASLLYCKAACYYKLGRDKDAVNTLAEALEDENSPKEAYNILLELVPELTSSKTYQSVIRYFRS